MVKPVVLWSPVLQKLSNPQSEVSAVLQQSEAFWNVACDAQIRFLTHNGTGDYVLFSVSWLWWFLVKQSTLLWQTSAVSCVLRVSITDICNPSCFCWAHWCFWDLSLLKLPWVFEFAQTEELCARAVTDQLRLRANVQILQVTTCWLTSPMP